MEFFGPLQPHELLAILATAADLGLTLYLTYAGIAREVGIAALAFKGRRAAVAVAVLGVLLHFVIRYTLSDPNRLMPHRQGNVWLGVAAIRGLIAAWNVAQWRRVSKRGA